jgi:hypothetical protein
MKRAQHILFGGTLLLSLIGLPACESTERTERPQAFTGQTEYSRSGDSRSAERREQPGPARLGVKGLHGPN